MTESFAIQVLSAGEVSLSVDFDLGPLICNPIDPSKEATCMGGFGSVANLPGGYASFGLEYEFVTGAIVEDDGYPRSCEPESCEEMLTPGTYTVSWSGQDGRGPFQNATVPPWAGTASVTLSGDIAPVPEANWGAFGVLLLAAKPLLGAPPVGDPHGDNCACLRKRRTSPICRADGWRHLLDRVWAPCQARLLSRAKPGREHSGRASLSSTNIKACSLPCLST